MGLEGKLSPSAQKVAKLLQEEPGLTYKEITQKIDLAPRTIRYAINDLHKNGFVRRLENMGPDRCDMRQSRHYLTLEYQIHFSRFIR